MQRLVLSIIVFVLTSTASAQLSKEMAAYYPDGKKIDFEYVNINKIKDSLGFPNTTSYSHTLGEVFFKRLTNQPIFVLFLDKEYPQRIEEMVSAYNYVKYLSSYEYYWDLKNMIEERILTKTYLQEVFKEPDAKGVDDEGKEYWLYKKFNVKVNFSGENATVATVTNYNAFTRHQLSISSFEVTGSDYSIGFDISLTNYSTKTIKYAYITVTATNPVNDKVGTKTATAVGPVKPTETGSYEFPNVIYSRTAKYLSIDAVKIQYMDGTTRLIPKAAVQDISVRDWEEFGQRTIDY